MSSPTDRFVPRYYEIEQALRARVAKLAPGDPLPSDAELCEEFGVSRMTARNAMAQLVQAGIVQRIPGRGTFVAEQPVHRQAGSLISFSDEMRRRGRRPSSRLLTRGHARGHAARRPTRSGCAAARRSSSWCACGSPTRSRSRSRPPPSRRGSRRCSRAPTSRRARCSTRWSAPGHVPTAGRASLVAEAATAADARHLGVKRGGPLLVERRLILDQSGRPLELTESRYAADRYTLEVSFDVELG